ncbi:MAG: hypothetical protein DMF61_24070 [Blastocatellia bacterium AA13]|nr:MAG: hypothetical protein DMF61_24070 [Blastocatellia bacterium AA13]
MPDENDQKSPSRNSHIFISYSRRDADAAQSLAKFCTDTGAETWLDRREVRPGENWRERLDEAIRHANIVLVLVSSAAQSDRPWQSREWSAICERKWIRPDVRIIPIRLDESEIPAFLSGLEALDGSNKAKLARCVDYITDYPAVRSVPGLASLRDEERKEVEKRFRELFQALSDALATPVDAPPEERSHD